MDYDKVIVLTAEANGPAQANPLDGIVVMDPNFTFLSQVMDYNTDAIQQDLTNAIAFFRDQFGIDFTGAPMDPNGGWKIQGAQLLPYYLSNNLGYRQILNLSGKTDNSVKQGGWMVKVEEPGIVGGGAYNKGKETFMSGGHIMIFGYFNIPQIDKLSKIIHYRSSAPHLTSFSSVLPSNLDIWDGDLNLWGKAEGTSNLTSNNDGTNHISIRKIITVPGRL